MTAGSGTACFKLWFYPRPSYNDNLYETAIDEYINLFVIARLMHWSFYHTNSWIKR